MAEVPKAERIFRIIRLLRERKKTAKQLGDILSTNLRTIYRDLDDIKGFGYLLVCDEHARYCLAESDNERRAYFTIEESRLIREHLSILSETHPLKSSILRKLYLSSELIPLADELADKYRGTIVSRINQAIMEGKRIRLLRYHSNNSDSVADRIVEPINLTESFSVLNAFEISSGKQKTFRVARMEDLEILSSNSDCKEAPEELDLFGFSGQVRVPVVVQLTSMAYRFLFEEFSAARAYLTRKAENDAYPYEFRAFIRDYRGLGRFLLGLPGETKVVEPEGLKEYLRGRSRKGEW
jgi:proteasome accessory factor C